MHLKTVLAVTAAALLVACSGGSGKPVQTAKVGDTQVSLSTASGTLTHGANDVTLAFSDAAGKPADVKEPSLRFTMPAMGTMGAMSATPVLAPAGQPGVFKGTVGLDMKGTWQATISFQDAAGPHQTTVDVQVQ